MELTPRQKSVYDFICKYHQRFAMAPSIREICNHLALSGTAGVHRILKILVEKGYLHSTPGKKRSWRPVAVGTSKRLPLVGKAAAGTPIGVFEQVDEYIPVDPKFYGHEGCFAVKIVGDSMIDAHILDGDIAVIRPAKAADDGTIVAVIIDDILPEAVLKIYSRKKDSVTLKSANPDYPPIVFKGRDCRKVRVIGRLAGIIRKS